MTSVAWPAANVSSNSNAPLDREDAAVVADDDAGRSSRGARGDGRRGRVADGGYVNLPRGVVAFVFRCRPRTSALNSVRKPAGSAP